MVRKVEICDFLKKNNHAVLCDKKNFEQWVRGEISDDDMIRYFCNINQIEEIDRQYITVEKMIPWLNSLGWRKGEID